MGIHDIIAVARLPIIVRYKPIPTETRPFVSFNTIIISITVNKTEMPLRAVMMILYKELSFCEIFINAIVDVATRRMRAK